MELDTRYSNGNFFSMTQLNIGDVFLGSFLMIFFLR